MMAGVGREVQSGLILNSAVSLATKGTEAPKHYNREGHEVTRRVPALNLKWCRMVPPQAYDQPQKTPETQKLAKAGPRERMKVRK